MNPGGLLPSTNITNDSLNLGKTNSIKLFTQISAPPCIIFPKPVVTNNFKDIRF